MLRKTPAPDLTGLRSSVSAPTRSPRGHASAIMSILFRNRRLFVNTVDSDQLLEEEVAPHLQKLLTAIETSSPVHLILPAFPAKSANRRKTLSDLPDLGERLGLRRLQALCDEIAAVHKPGARCTICSDGRVFSDLVGVADAAVTAYREELKKIIAELGLGDVSVFDLDDVFSHDDFDMVREELLVSYAEPMSVLRRRTREEASARELFNGIHRYVFEDMVEREGDGRTRSGHREVSKNIAYRLIQRSNAWTKLIAERFPEAVRLSIHPQPRVSDKIGVYLVPTANPWGTPWHNVVLQGSDGNRLVPRSEAEARGALLIYSGGRPSHFVDAGLVKLEVCP